MLELGQCTLSKAAATRAHTSKHVANATAIGCLTVLCGAQIYLGTWGHYDGSTEQVLVDCTAPVYTGTDAAHACRYGNQQITTPSSWVRMRMSSDTPRDVFLLRARTFVQEVRQRLL